MLRNPKTKIKDPPAIRRALHAWFRRNGRDLPWRRDSSPYAVLVSEFMLQQTQVATVIPYFERWMARFPTFAALAAASEEDVLSLWQGLGYYSRARRLQQAAISITAELGAVLPPDLKTIAALPGVGRYTAGAVAAFAFDLPVPTVDGNIARVLARLTHLTLPIDSREGEAALWETAAELLPPKSGRIHTSALIELGALVCTPRVPACDRCPVSAHCAAPDPAGLPRKRPRPTIVELQEYCGWTVDRGRILLEQQVGARWRGLWKLPRVDSAVSGESLYSSTYPFTNHRVRLEVRQAPAPSRVQAPVAWVSRAEIPTIPLAAPHRRAIMHLLKGAAGAPAC